jgi:hypothetical protein
MCDFQFGLTFSHTLTTRLWIWTLTVCRHDYLHVWNVGKYCLSTFLHILFNFKKAIKIKQVLSSGVHSSHVTGQMVPYMLRQQRGIIRTLKMIIPYFPVDNARVIYTKAFSKRKKTTVHVMQLKSKKFQIIYIPMYTII